MRRLGLGDVPQIFRAGNNVQEGRGPRPKHRDKFVNTNQGRKHRIVARRVIVGPAAVRA